MRLTQSLPKLPKKLVFHNGVDDNFDEKPYSLICSRNVSQKKENMYHNSVVEEIHQNLEINRNHG